MFSEEDLLPISALQHLAFCERQWGLIHLEQQWNEKVCEPKVTGGKSAKQYMKNALRQALNPPGAEQGGA